MNSDDEGRQYLTKERREILEGIGYNAVISAGVTGGIFGFLSALFSADAVSKPAYRRNEQISTAYEPAIKHAAKTGELDIRTIEIGYGLDDRGELDQDKYNSHVEDIMMELPGLEEVNVSYRYLEPEEGVWIPDNSTEMAEFQVGERRPGLQSLMEAAGETLREEKHQLVNLITTSGKIFAAGGTHPDIDGVAFIENESELEEIAETSAHEDAHLLGVGHTIADGMTNVPVGQWYSERTENFFGPKSKEWWEEIMESYEHEGE